MEEKLLERLEKIYKNLKINVVFKDFNYYDIILDIEHLGTTYETKLTYKYNNNLTEDANIIKIVDIIDSDIILNFYKTEV